ncbi:MAG TPA: 50S ribosomal protein L21 [Candidatus Dormibacteraeota bacterium]|nr:50S ribosomal protein L21 [Candidatus Dormibacteraeota bacterium]
MPKPDGVLSAVVVSGGKQYRVAPGDRILVDRLSAEAGSSIKLGRVLMLADGDGLKVGSALDGVDVDAKVVGHPRGPRLESIRYKSKKRVRVHHGGRAHLTALEIIAVGGVGIEKPEAPEKSKEKEENKKPARGRAKAAPKKKVEEPAAEASADATDAGRAPGANVKKPARRRTKKETE